MARVTIKDVAERAGVSIATVSYVINDTGSVSEATAERVRDCIDELGYRVNSLAVAHRTGRTKTIVLALPDLSNPFCPEIAKGVQSAARSAGFAVVLLDANSDGDLERDSIARVADRMPEGLVWVPLGDSSWTPEEIGIPVVAIDAWGVDFDTVRADVRDGGARQGLHMIECGHRRVGLVSGPSWSATAHARHEGLIDAIGSQVDVAWDVALPYSSNLDDRLVATMLASDVTCIATANDIQAIGVLKALHRNGRSVPDDVSVIGFDDVPLAALMSPGLSTVRLPIEEMGRTAFELLCRRIDAPGREREEVVLPVDFVERESSRQRLSSPR